MGLNMDARIQIKKFEGKENKAYGDPLTGAEPWTIGYGHTGPEVHEGLVWTDEECDLAFEKDFAHAEYGCQKNLPWFEQLNDPRKAVLIGMAFQMGIKGLLGFMNTLGKIRDEHFADAANNMMLSQWAKQTPKRARRLAAQMDTGEWQ